MQAVNPYEILGIKNDANLEEIIQAFRKKVKQLHPDTNPNSQQNSHELNYLLKAYNFLRNNKNRELYNNGKIDFCGRYNKKIKKTNNNRKTKNTDTVKPKKYINFFDKKFLEKNIRSFLQNKKTSIKNIILKNDTNSTSVKLISIPFTLSIRGGVKKIKLKDNNNLIIKIPAGIKEGQIIKLKRQGELSLNGNKKDLLIKIRIQKHQLLERDGDNIIHKLPITISEAILGGKVKVPTVDGNREIFIPRGSNSGKVLRLKGLGVMREKNNLSGDQLIKLIISFPKKIDHELEDFALNWSKKNYNPRNIL